ncbi:glycosyltransferase [Sulfitobacter sabulilitoris]|uniref:Glycosyltransferase family 4 protein n=1 Tax=Sulfitobacter sabulilitoris TaxID=2562655 RepID=A0A5S3PH32_9RHOB|nr:glycosyltransferase [Sulfitobacter sabulilitoris]TMM51054.1 glycosyltransferase family 4 protein [Sulfitobacter sabulilitoris]
MKVAIVHYWLVGMRGGERVLEELVRLYPQADIYTHVADRASLSDVLNSRPITETFIARLPGARKHYQKYLGFMPRALEELDLTGYDLVISSESGPAKGVIVPPDAAHVCYVHTPMRYIWDHYGPYRDRLGWLGRMYFSGLAHRLRVWDVTSAARVDRFVANSTFIARRIRRFYNRDATVVHPPVDLEAYRLPRDAGTRDYYLFVSQLVPYKRADLVIEAFRDLDHRLLVVGDGSQRAELERNLPSNVELLGRVAGENLPALYQGAKALIFPAEEDFGIVPVEAMACGTPVLAYGRGGVCDSVVDGKTGLFFDRQDTTAIREVVARFERRAADFDPVGISDHAAGFGAERFRRDFARVVEDVLADQSGNA